MTNQKNNFEQANQEIDLQVDGELAVNKFSDNKNKIWIIIGIVFAVIIMISGGVLLFLQVSDNRQKLNVDQEMLGLCRENDSCCLASLNAIGKDNFELADESGNCPEGFKKNMLRCESSLQWCEPVQFNGDLNNKIDEKIALCEEIIYEDSKDRCYLDYAMSINNTNLCEKITSSVLKEECYNNLNKKDETDKPVLWALGSEPDAIPVAKAADVLFTTMQTGLEDKANKIIVEELDVSGSVIRILGGLNDDGVNGDLSANDYVYSGTFKVASAGEGTLFFRAKANFSGILDPVYTDKYKLGVTRFPIESYPSDMSKVITDPKTGEKMISNEVIVGFIEGTSPDTIENILKAVNADIVGTIFGLGAYQIKIPDTGDTTGVNKAINDLLNYSEVEYAEPNYIGELDVD